MRWLAQVQGRVWCCGVSPAPQTRTCRSSTSYSASGSSGKWVCSALDQPMRLLPVMLLSKISTAITASCSVTQLRAHSRACACCVMQEKRRWQAVSSLLRVRVSCVRVSSEFHKTHLADPDEALQHAYRGARLAALLGATLLLVVRRQHLTAWVGWCRWYCVLKLQ